MNKSALEEAATWKLEAKLEDSSRYFYQTKTVGKLESGDKAYVIGRKGTGKTAITEHLTSTKEPTRYSKKLSFKNFPFGDLYKLTNDSFTSPNEYITLWKYLIYSSVAKLLIENHNIDVHLRDKLSKVYEGDIEQSLARTIRRWVGKSLKFSILGTGVEGGTSNEHKENPTPWVERVEFLEDLLLRNLDDAKYLIVFDELDEDYKDILVSQKHKQYTALLTSLFKAAQDIRSIFSSNQYNLYPIIFLRDDIFDIIDDPDRTKWNDLKVTLDWNEKSIKDLLAFRISRAISSTGKILNFTTAWNKLFINQPIRYGTRQHKQIPAFTYILKSTHLRPRDFVRYIQACAETALEYNHSKIGAKTIRRVDKAFSNYLRSALEDEIHGAIQEINRVLDLFSRIRKQTLTIDEFHSAYTAALESNEFPDKSADFVLKILFHYSVIGNQPSQKNVHVFRYKSPEARFNQKEKNVIHRGLFKSLQII